MKRTLFLTIFLILTSLIFVSLAFAKGSPDKIIIWGPSLAKPIEITDPKTLKGFDPWNGQFLDRSSGVIEDEPRPQEIYTVVFDLGNNNLEKRSFYVFQYSPGPSGGQGFIYLSREGEPWHLINGQTIIRASGWHYASAEWDVLVHDTLEKDRVSPVEPVISRDLQLAVPIIIFLGGSAIIWYLRRRQPVSIQHQ
jgi:hypothetical protein